MYNRVILVGNITRENKQEAIKDIPGYEGLYAITKNGDVWSHPKKNKYTRHSGKWVSKVKDKGYEYVVLYKNGKRKKIAVHRLVGITYLVGVDGKNQINHKNGIKDDNRVDNLEWCSAKENCQHAWDNGLSKVSERMRSLNKEKIMEWNSSQSAKDHHSRIGKKKRKLSTSQVLEILGKNKNGQSAYSISKEYPVSKQTILKIINHRTYKDIRDEL